MKGVKEEDSRICGKVRYKQRGVQYIQENFSLIEMQTNAQVCSSVLCGFSLHFPID